VFAVVTAGISTLLPQGEATMLPAGVHVDGGD
jgi:hypothetical protein